MENSPTTTPSGKEPLPDHVRPNVSCLESYRADIAEGRMRKWPFAKIAALLAERYQLKITGRAISDFCQRRGIKKGIGESIIKGSAPNRRARANSASENASVEPNAALAHLLPKFRKKKIFTPREGPIRTRSNGGLDEET